MSEKIIVIFSGWCECNPDKVNFVWMGGGQLPNGYKDVITGTEWLALTPTEDEGTIGPYRDDYCLESCADAQLTAIDGSYDDIHVEVEEE